jgi:hypothetical protein
MPVNWYAALVVIVILGIASVAWARYEYTKTTTSTTEPLVGQTWHAGLAFDICGTAEAALPASPSGTTGLTTTGSGVLLIAPKTSAEAGNNATLGKFASEYQGLTLSNSAVKYPGGTEYKNGQKCAAGTPDAGERGVVRARVWLLSSKSGGSQLSQVGGAYASKPADLKLRNRQLMTVGFGPTTQTLPKVPATTEVALLQAIEGTTAPVTTTTAAPTTTTTTGAHVTTPTTKPSG